MNQKLSSAPLTVQDIMRLTRKVREAIARLDDLLHELDELGERAPADLRLMSEPALKLRQHFTGDLASLEAALAEARG